MSGHEGHLGIVVGVDGSSASSTAAKWAAHEAAMRRVPLTLAHVIFDQRRGQSLFGARSPLPAEPDQQQQALGQRFIDDAMRVVNASLGSEVRPKIRGDVLLSPTVPALVDLSKDAQLMVVGCRGQGLLERTLLGSVSNELIQRAHCPVAVIHDETSQPETLSLLPVVVGIDGSPASELATAIAFKEASWRGVELVAVHVWRDSKAFDIGTVEWSAHQAGAVEALSERLAGWQERYPDVQVYRKIVSGDPAGHLLDLADSSQLVVVGSRGLSGFEGMLLGSVSSTVVQGARIPVIVARPS